jgi:hypothetical protein
VAGSQLDQAGRGARGDDPPSGFAGQLTGAAEQAVEQEGADADDPVTLDPQHAGVMSSPASTSTSPAALIVSTGRNHLPFGIGRS